MLPRMEESLCDIAHAYTLTASTSDTLDPHGKAASRIVHDRELAPARIEDLQVAAALLGRLLAAEYPAECSLVAIAETWSGATAAQLEALGRVELDLGMNSPVAF
jgi:hypothetical protein